jgi:twitching motility two-component system response regulator PilG
MHNKVWKEIQDFGSNGASSIRGEAMDQEKVCDEEMIRCHFCYSPVPLEVNQCHYCNAYFKITKEIIPKINKNIDQKELHQAIHRYENVLSREVNTKVLFYAGLAWMHLDNFDATLDFFEQLQLSIGKSSSIYAKPVEHIVAYIASKQAEKESINQPKKKKQSKELPVLSEISKDKKILVVEDSPTTRKVIKMTLNSNGFHVDEAADGIEALSKLNDTHPDLILLDVMLPKLDGYGILSVLKKNEDFKHIPVIMLTSKDSLKDRLKGRFSSASAYLTKPFKPNELIVKVNKFTM